MKKQDKISAALIVIFIVLLITTFLLVQDVVQKEKALSYERMFVETLKNECDANLSEIQIYEVELSRLKFEMIQMEYIMNQKHFDYVIDNIELLGGIGE